MKKNVPNVYAVIYFSMLQTYCEEDYAKSGLTDWNCRQDQDSISVKNHNFSFVYLLWPIKCSKEKLQK